VERTLLSAAFDSTASLPSFVMQSAEFQSPPIKRSS
jgi:hypothetical protein